VSERPAAPAPGDAWFLVTLDAAAGTETVVLEFQGATKLFSLPML
jgi:hypothetical protein